MDKFVGINIPYRSKKLLFDWQNRQSSITTFSWWIKDKSKFRRKNANAQLYSFRKTKLENFWSQVMEAGKINFPNCTKPPKSQNEKKVEALKTALVSFTIKDIDCTCEVWKWFFWNEIRWWNATHLIRKGFIINTMGRPLGLRVYGSKSHLTKPFHTVQ